ncbi:MAG: YifB family Mg chelatase-like AAA ATPase [Acidimicrobiaceae bacterium]|nr:YifB family Mg chelatase-like AAA ATPase [Acidimicrobiaceae bacterium]
MLATIRSATLVGVWGHPVFVEVHVANGLPTFTVVGLPDASCREARDRVRSAITSSRLEWPMHRVTVNLAPGDVHKAGAGLDFSIAIGLLIASGQLSGDAAEDVGFLGEVGLDGSIRSVPGALPLVDAIKANTVVVSADDVEVARLVAGGHVRAVRTLREAYEALAKNSPWPDLPLPPKSVATKESVDMADISGQPFARWGMEVAAAGGHHMLFVGPPGAGKTMLSRRLVGLLPDLTPDMALEATRVHSAAGLPLPAGGLITRPPMRAPHHSASMASLIGGTSKCRPGEASCATGGVLFLDELGEFAPSALDALRQPLEEGMIRVSRAKGTIEHPARFLLVAAMNPCPCGAGGETGCRCNSAAVTRYQRRLSGPFVDRLDIVIHVDCPDPADLLDVEGNECSARIAERVRQVRELSHDRGVNCNSELDGPQLEEHAPLSDAAVKVLRKALTDGRMTARGLRRVRSVARTIRDLDDGGERIRDIDVLAAMSLRSRPQRVIS